MRAAPERRTVAYATCLALIVVCYAYSEATPRWEAQRIDREGGEGSRADWHGEPCAGSGCTVDAGLRRPTGAPPPLPHPVSVTSRAWLVLVVVVLAGVIVISVRARCTAPAR